LYVKFVGPHYYFLAAVSPDVGLVQFSEM
jgi:hypothetical protein